MGLCFILVTAWFHYLFCNSPKRGSYHFTCTNVQEVQSIFSFIHWFILFIHSLIHSFIHCSYFAGLSTEQFKANKSSLHSIAFNHHSFSQCRAQTTAENEIYTLCCRANERDSEESADQSETKSDLFDQSETPPWTNTWALFTLVAKIQFWRECAMYIFYSQLFIWECMHILFWTPLKISSTLMYLEVNHCSGSLN